jgi:hypothetical protein
MVLVQRRQVPHKTQSDCMLILVLQVEYWLEVLLPEHHRRLQKGRRRGVLVGEVQLLLPPHVQEVGDTAEFKVSSIYRQPTELGSLQCFLEGDLVADALCSLGFHPGRTF